MKKLSETHLANSTSSMHGFGSAFGSTYAMHPIIRLPDGKGQN